MPPLQLAFSAGGAKCAAQAGVLAALTEAHTPVGSLTGVSAGGLVAILFGLGLSPSAIRDYIAETHLLEVWELDPERQAVFGADKIRARLRQVVGERTFADLRWPVTVVAADLDSGQLVRLNNGRLDEALLATIAMPGLFKPITQAGRRLVDGGGLNPMPVDVARAVYGPPVVAVDVVHHRQTGPIFEASGPLKLALEAGRRLRLMDLLEIVYLGGTLTANQMIADRLQLTPPDYLLQPAVGRVGLFAFDLAAEAFAEGQAAGRTAAPELQALAR